MIYLTQNSLFMVQLIMKTYRSYFRYTGWFVSLILKLFGFSREKQRAKRKKNIKCSSGIENLFWASYRSRVMRGWCIL